MINITCYTFGILHYGCISTTLECSGGVNQIQFHVLRVFDPAIFLSVKGMMSHVSARQPSTCKRIWQSIQSNHALRQPTYIPPTPCTLASHDPLGVDPSVINQRYQRHHIRFQWSQVGNFVSNCSQIHCTVSSDK